MNRPRKPVRARNIAPQDVLSISACVPETEVPGTWRALAAELRDYLNRHGQRAAGPIGAIFPDLVHDDDAVHMTVFMPTSDPPMAKGRIAAGRVEGGLAATIVHLGPYTLLDRSYEQLVSWMQRHGHEIARPPREIYWLGPTETDDPNSYETEVIWPVH